MKRIGVLFFLFILSIGQINAQEAKNDLVVIRSVADKIIREHSYRIVDKKTGICYADTKNLPDGDDYKLESKYLEWRYVNGVLNMAMLDLSQFTGQAVYKDFALNNYRYFFTNRSFLQKQFDKGVRDAGYYRFLRMQSLDDCGAMVAALIEVYKQDNKKEYMDYINRTADYVLHKEGRLADGTFSRGPEGNKTVWLDDLYMSVSFLANMGELSGDPVYFDCATKQVIQFSNLLYEPCSGLYYHCYYDYLKQTGVAHWGRANGWSIFAQANLLSRLPKNYPQREELLKIFPRQVLGFSRYQSESGLWHQLLDKNDSYLETSCTAMFTYAVAKGVNEGWLDKGFSTIALCGWNGIKNHIAESGEVSNICIGTGISHDLTFYYQRPTPLSDVHGLGAIIQAGMEIIKMKKQS